MPFCYLFLKVKSLFLITARADRHDEGVFTPCYALGKTPCVPKVVNPLWNPAITSRCCAHPFGFASQILELPKCTARSDRSTAQQASLKHLSQGDLKAALQWAGVILPRCAFAVLRRISFGDHDIHRARLSCPAALGIVTGTFEGFSPFFCSNCKTHAALHDYSCPKNS